MKKDQANEYIRRINTVCDYIDHHLGREMTLDELARVAGFSPYHFHRIFSAMTGETLFAFIQRLRLEHAAAMICSNAANTITDIAQECGFSSSSVFSRLFKQRFDCTPSVFRSRNEDQTNSNLYQLLRNSTKACYGSPGYNNAVLKDNTHKRRVTMEQAVSIEKIEETRVAYVRYVGPYQGDSALFENLYKRLFGWAGPRGIDGSVTYILYHDDPDITDEQKLRTSVCVPIDSEIEVSGEIGEMTIGGGEFAVGHFVLGSDEYKKAWDYMCGEWLPRSGYQPRNLAPFERYRESGCREDGKMGVDICIPVEVM